MNVFHYPPNVIKRVLKRLNTVSGLILLTFKRERKNNHTYLMLSSIYSIDTITPKELLHH